MTTPLVEYDDVTAYLNFHPTAGSDDERLLEDAITRASALCEEHLGRPLARATYTTLRMSGRGCALWLNGPIKVDDAVTVTLDGVSQTVWRSEADGDPIDFDVTVRSSVPGSPWCPDQLHRNLGWEGAGVRDQPIVLSYTGGFTVAPDSVREACLLVVQKVYRDGARQQADVATVSTPGGAMTLYDSFIPRRAQQILDAHRRILV